MKTINNVLILCLLVPIFAKTQTHASVCLINENGEPFSSQTLTEGQASQRPFVQLMNNNGDILLPEHTYRLPLSVALQGEPCFNQPFYLLNDNGDYQWINIDGEVLYDVYWFDNGPDYASEGLFRFKQNGLIGYADAETFAIVIPAQFTIAHPFKDNKASIVYEQTNKDNVIIINKQGHIIND